MSQIPVAGKQKTNAAEKFTNIEMDLALLSTLVTAVGLADCAKRFRKNQRIRKGDELGAMS